MTPPVDERDLTSWLVGGSTVMRELRSTIARVATVPIPVWIEGETGVGKEQVAQAIHAASGRRGAFVAVNACAISDSMFEDAFFGHVRGAFTGALGETFGYFGEADRGTLFLDEVSGLSVAAQIKLLRAVETRRYRQVGGSKDRTSDFRLLAASNELFDELVREGRFRQDLGFRLRGAVFRVPPLRARLSDIPPLVEHFLATIEGSDARGVSAGAMEWLSSQSWEGNVRELRQLLLCAGALGQGAEITVDLLRSARGMMGVRTIEQPRAGTQQSERQSLTELLIAAHWDTASLAGMLGVDRTTVYRRMRRLGIEPPRNGQTLRMKPWAAAGQTLGDSSKEQAPKT